MSEQRCGNCRWWHGSLKAYDQLIGNCAAPVPHAVLPRNLRAPGPDKRFMLNTEGKDCPCWQEKEKQP